MKALRDHKKEQGGRTGLKGMDISCQEKRQEIKKIHIISKHKLQHFVRSLSIPNVLARRPYQNFALSLLPTK